MALNESNATAADYENAGKRHGIASLYWIIITAVVFWLLDGWGWFCVGFTGLSLLQSFYAYRQAAHLRAGTFKSPNPNNGAPDGDARNLDVAEKPPAEQE